MRVQPVSADLLVKLALGAVVIGAAWYAVSRTRAAVASAFNGVGDLPGHLWNVAANAAYAVSPTNQNNVLYQTANGGLSAVLGREETLGGWLYDVTHPDPLAKPLPNLQQTDAGEMYDVLGNRIW